MRPTFTANDAAYISLTNAELLRYLTASYLSFAATSARANVTAQFPDSPNIGFAQFRNAISFAIRIETVGFCMIRILFRREIFQVIDVVARLDTVTVVDFFSFRTRPYESLGNEFMYCKPFSFVSESDSNLRVAFPTRRLA
jgi:hypothetical protein